jgi:prepilin-type processing-associated H-X9-DG protein
VTDSVSQGTYAVGWLESGDAANKVFTNGYAYSGQNADMKMAEVEDPVNFVIFCDGGYPSEWIHVGTIVAPELCALPCANSVCGWADWNICTWATDCGLYNVAPNDGSFLSTSEHRKEYARHLGGNNFGFLDGHAQWMLADSALTRAVEGDMTGLYVWWGPNSTCGFTGAPTLY